VRLAVAYGAIELVVTDDGRGFDPVAASAGFGLVGMRERVALVRGNFDIAPAPGAGTTIRVQVPLETLPAAPTGTP